MIEHSKSRLLTFGMLFYYEIKYKQMIKRKETGTYIW